MKTIDLPIGMLSVHSVSCAAYAVGETHACHSSCDVYAAFNEGWRQRQIMRGDVPDPGGVQWICPACLLLYRTRLPATTLIRVTLIVSMPGDFLHEQGVERVFPMSRSKGMLHRFNKNELSTIMSIREILTSAVLACYALTQPVTADRKTVLYVAKPRPATFLVTRCLDVTRIDAFRDTMDTKRDVLKIAIQKIPLYHRNACEIEYNFEPGEDRL